jgi:hypothetical protein
MGRREGWVGERVEEVYGAWERVGRRAGRCGRLEMVRSGVEVVGWVEEGEKRCSLGGVGRGVGWVGWVC